MDITSAAKSLCAQAKSSEYRLARRNLKILMMAAPLVRSQSNTLLLLTKAMAKFVDVRLSTHDSSVSRPHCMLLLPGAHSSLTPTLQQGRRLHDGTGPCNPLLQMSASDVVQASRVSRRCTRWWHEPDPMSRDVFGLDDAVQLVHEVWDADFAGSGPGSDETHWALAASTFPDGTSAIGRSGQQHQPFSSVLGVSLAPPPSQTPCSLPVSRSSSMTPHLSPSLTQHCSSCKPMLQGHSMFLLAPLLWPAWLAPHCVRLPSGRPAAIQLAVSLLL